MSALWFELPAVCANGIVCRRGGRCGLSSLRGKLERAVLRLVRVRFCGIGGSRCVAPLGSREVVGHGVAAAWVLAGADDIA